MSLTVPLTTEAERELLEMGVDLETAQNRGPALWLVCIDALKATGGSKIWNGETHAFLKRMEELTGFVPGEER